MVKYFGIMQFYIGKYEGMKWVEMKGSTVLVL